MLSQLESSREKEQKVEGKKRKFKTWLHVGNKGDVIEKVKGNGIHDEFFLFYIFWKIISFISLTRTEISIWPLKMFLCTLFFFINLKPFFEHIADIFVFLFLHNFFFLFSLHNEKKVDRPIFPLFVFQKRKIHFRRFSQFIAKISYKFSLWEIFLFFIFTSYSHFFTVENYFLKKIYKKKKNWN